MINQILFLDFETYYDQKTYTLRDLTPPEYILDPRFEVIMCAAALNDGPQTIIDGRDFEEFIRGVDPSLTATVTYNSLFDNSILAWRYDWVPARMFDSMNMARALRGHILPNLKLSTVAPILLGENKGDTYLKVSGMRRADIRQAQIYREHDLWEQMCDYCIRDNELSRRIFKLLIREFPEPERRVMDLVIRCAVEPKFLLDKQRLKDHLKKIKKDKENLLTAAGVDDKTLMSNLKFQAALEGLGVEIEYKTSVATGKLTPAFAKTDQFMSDLQEHDDPRVQALVCARLGLKSTLEETRCEKFLRIADCSWTGSSPTLPVPLKYAGAHTHRLSGDWGMNLQNLPRGSELRNCLVAPPGYSVVVSDLAQIEARVVAWMAGQDDLLSTFSTKDRPGDPYSSFASILFCRFIDRLVDKIERFIGKTGVLGLGYGCGPEKFYRMVKTLARGAGIDISVVFNEGLARQAVVTYREKYSKITALWSILNNRLYTNLVNGAVSMVGPVEISKGTVMGPGYLKMVYDDVIQNPVNYEFHATYGNKRFKLYGAKLLENVVQFLSRIIIMNTALRLNDRGYRFCLQAHDELVFIVPEGNVEEAKKIIYEEMTRTPFWAKGLPLDAEVKSGPSYGDCK